MEKLHRRICVFRTTTGTSRWIASRAEAPAIAMGVLFLAACAHAQVPRTAASTSGGRGDSVSPLGADMVHQSGAPSLTGNLGTSGDERGTSAASCSAIISRTNVVSCALRASMSARAEEHGLRSIEGRRTAASLLLPSNPTLSLSGGYPIEPGVTERPMLWSATLSQEIEIAGQRGTRLSVTSAERRAQEQKLIAVRRDVAVRAVSAYFDALAALESAKVADRLTGFAEALKTVASARAQAGVGSDVDAQLAGAAAIRIAEAQIAAKQRVAATSAALATVLGLDPDAALHLEGELVPLAAASAPPKALVEGAIARRAELNLVLAERELQDRRRALYERLRYPNPTVSLFARSDWIGERSIGVGLGFPIPLPSPVGRTYAGEIAEAAALSDRAAAEAEGLRRSIRLEVTSALAAVAARKDRVDLYSPERVTQVQTVLAAIGQEIQARRLPVREALLTQQGLIDVLSGYVEARRELCIASVELANAAGLSLEEGMR